MRILIYSHAFAPKFGGVETVVMSLAKGLAERKEADGKSTVEVTVATPTAQGVGNDAELPFTVVREPSLLQLVRLIRATDILHLAGPAFLPMVVALVLGKRMVVEHHGFQTICPNGQLLHEPTQLPCPGYFMAGRHGQCLRCNTRAGMFGSLKLWALTFPRRWLCTRAAQNITPTNWLSTLLKLPRMTTIHHGLPNHRVNVEPPAPSAPTTFAFIGRLVSTKGAQTLLQAAHILSSEGLRYQLKIIGDGPDRLALQKQVAELGIADSVQLLGYLPEARLEEQLRGVATVVMPSLAGEVFGMVAAENMARGKLLVYSDVGAMGEVVGDDGLSFPAGDVNSLAACLRRVLAEPGLAESLGKKARERMTRLFGEQRMLSQHVATYRELFASSTAR